MTKNEITDFPLSPAWQDAIVRKARRDARSKTQDWPGTPLSQMLIKARGDLQQLIADGRVQIVERPRSAGREGTVSYVVPTHSA